MTRTPIVVAWLLLAAEACLGQKEAESVCQILGHLEEFTGQVVRVRAKVQSDVDTWLAAGTDCPVRITVGMHIFSRLIALTWPDSAIVELSRLKVPFPTDWASRRLLGEALNRPRVRMDATVEGLIVTRDPPLALVHPDFPKVALGFGHLAMAPAQIVVKRISDVEVTYRREDGKMETVPGKLSP